MKKIFSFILKPIVGIVLGLIIVFIGASLVLQSQRYFWITGIIALALGSLLVIFLMITKKDLLART